MKRAYVTVDGNEICAWLSDGEEPTGIRYAWKDCPMNICLYGKKGTSGHTIYKGVGQGCNLYW